jgi:hypothetical protein
MRGPASRRQRRMSGRLSPRQGADIASRRRAASDAPVARISNNGRRDRRRSRRSNPLSADPLGRRSRGGRAIGRPDGPSSGAGGCELFPGAGEITPIVRPLRGPGDLLNRECPPCRGHSSRHFLRPLGRFRPPGLLNRRRLGATVDGISRALWGVSATNMTLSPGGFDDPDQESARRHGLR